MLKHMSIVVALVLAASSGCGQRTAPDGSDGSVSLATDLQPLLTERCAGCHFTGSSLASGLAMDLTAGLTHASIVGMTSELDDMFSLVVPGQPQESLFYLKMALDDPPAGQRMPLFASRLSPEELQLFEDWIMQGAADN